MFNGLVSIALCTYRGANFIAEQLNSIANQSHLPDEIVIVDDASDDATVQIVRAFSNESSLNIKLHINKSTCGVIKNFQRAIELCQGDVIFLADQDDIWESGKISSHLTAYSENANCGYVFSDALLVNVSGKSLEKNLWEAVGFDEKRQLRYAAGTQIETMLNGGNFIYGNALSFKGEYKDSVLPIDSRSFGCTHDVWISHILSAIGARGVALPSPLLRYRQHPAQQAGAGRKRSAFNRLRDAYRSKDQFFVERARDLKAIKDRSTLIGCGKLHQLEMLEECARHMNARHQICSTSVVRSLPVVTREWISGRYGKFSSSWRSVVRDLLAQH